MSFRRAVCCACGKCGLWAACMFSLTTAVPFNGTMPMPHQNTHPLKHPPIPLPAWLAQPGPDQEVVLSTRCRIARNVAGYPFPWRANELQRKQIAETLLDACQRGGGSLAEARRFKHEALQEEAMDQLIEYRYASPLWAGTDREKR